MLLADQATFMLSLMCAMHHIDTQRRGTTGRQERLPCGLSILLIVALSALCWAVLIAIVRALLLL